MFMSTLEPNENNKKYNYNGKQILKSTDNAENKTKTMNKTSQLTGGPPKVQV